MICLVLVFLVMFLMKLVFILLLKCFISLWWFSLCW